MDSSLGSRPSFAWRSLLHGRELLQQGLVTRIGNGSSTNVWWDKWIIDTVPRTPDYRPGSVVDLTLKVEDLMDHHTGLWNRDLVLHTFSQADAATILKLQPRLSQADSVVWGFTKNGVYSSKSGYALLEELEELSSPPLAPLPPVEKQLWKSIWKAKTTPKLRHFLWRILSGALAVKERLRSRGINIDATCSSCGNGREDINHVLFQCRFARDVWSLSAVPMPPSGSWSNSVFLNLYHLVKCINSKRLAPEAGLVFPWLLWHIWKARNLFSFEYVRLDAANILDKAIGEADIWRELQAPLNAGVSRSHLPTPDPSRWSKPSIGWIKCNVAASWSTRSANSGGAWITRNREGQTLHHSRRSFSNVDNPLEADLRSLLWSIEEVRSLRLGKVIFETSSPTLRDVFINPQLHPQFGPMTSSILLLLNSFMDWRVEHVSLESNKVASLVASSVTRDHRYSSYVASGGPSWFTSLLVEEAA